MTAKDIDFVPVRVSTLRGDQPLLFDLFVRVAGKHILYCREGGSFEGVRLNRLKEKNIRQLFIRLESENAYRQYLSRNIELAYANAANKPIEQRVQIIQGLQQAATEEVLENPTDQRQYEIFKIDTRRYVEFLLLEDQSLRCVLAIENQPSNIAHHAVNVATLATALAHKSGITDVGQIHLLAVGCLLHDLEHLHSGLDVNRPLTSLTPAELDLYRHHPDRASARIQETKFYDQLVRKIIRHHHEHINGEGFPDQLKETDLDPMIWMAAVADAYDRLINYEAVSPKDALKQLMIDKVGLYPLSLIQNMTQILKDKGVA